jgi:myo-inositol-1(or 4)-monophosphatase
LLSWVGRHDVREKGPSDLVTEADFASQDAVRKVILEAFPTHQFVSEEGEGDEDLLDEFCWIVDPLDGTTNYVHQMPHYAVSVALAQHGSPTVGVVYDPVRDECFAAQRGRGATLNGRAIRVSRVNKLADALVAASFAAKVEPGSPEVTQFLAALSQCQAVRRTGSAALNLCYLAAGRFDVFWALSTKAWDVAAGALLVEEAGGLITHYGGQPFELARPHPVASATREVHAAFLELIQATPSAHA